MKKIIALLILATSMTAAQTVVTGNGVTGAQGTGNISPSADATSDIGTLSLRWRNLFLSGVIKWTDGAGNAYSGISSTLSGQIMFGNGASGSTNALLIAQNFYGNGTGGASSIVIDASNNIVRQRSTGVYGFSASTTDSNTSQDTGFSRCGVGISCFGNGTNADFSGTSKSASDIIADANGGTWTRGFNSELLTLAAAATTDTVGNLLPANSIIEAVVVRVVTVIPTAATFTVGDATIAARFATGVAVAATTTAVGLTQVDQTGTSGPKQTAAAKVRITPNLTPGTATGQVRITVFYRSFVAPTS